MMARSVADLEIMLDVMSEFPVEKMQGRRKFRIGLIRGFFYQHATNEARSLHDKLAQKLAESGFQVEEITLPAIFEVANPVLRTIIRSETASVHEKLFPSNRETYAPKIRAMVETGMLVPAEDYVRARRLRRKYQKEMLSLFEKCDVLMTPAAPGTAPEGITATGDPVMNGPWTLADFPTMTIPHALGANGLPIGVQLSAPPLQEGLLLAVGKAVEAVVGGKP